jgi:peptidyl-prolyl cis-trans isomerase D
MIVLHTLRRNVRRLSWTLWLVIAAFIALYLPAMFTSGAANVVARVNGEPIEAAEFQRAMNEQMQYYRGLNQGELPDNFIQQMQLQSVVLEQLIRRRLIVEAAEEQGFSIARQELKDRMLQYPAFRREDGRWIGDEEYRTILQRNGLDVASFEESIMDDLLVERVTGLITEGVVVNDRDVEDAYQRQSEKVRFDFVQVRPTAYRFEVDAEITDADVRAAYEADPDAYRLAEQRVVSYALIDTEELRNSVEISADALSAEYQASLAEFTIEEQVKARQIMLRVPPAASDEGKAAVRSRAEEVLQRLNAGADFNEVAEQVSDDPTSETGGDLGWVTRGRQVEGFDEAAFVLQPGDTSEVVETAFGFHIIRVDDRRDEHARPFEEVRGQLEQRLAWDQAETQAEAISEQMRRDVLRGDGLEEVAEQYGLTVEVSPLFAQETGFGEFTAIDLTNRIFTLGTGRVAEPVRVPRGYLVFRVDEIVVPYVPELDGVVGDVRSDVIDRRAAERAAERAQEYAERLAAGEELAAIAPEAGTVVESSVLVAREDIVPVLGSAPALLQAAFQLAAGQTGGPVELDDRFVVLQVLEHIQPDWGVFAEQKEQLREQEAVERRNRLFEAYLQSLRESYSVTVDQSVIDTIVS